MSWASRSWSRGSFHSCRVTRDRVLSQPRSGGGEKVEFQTGIVSAPVQLPGSSDGKTRPREGQGRTQGAPGQAGLGAQSGKSGPGPTQGSPHSQGSSSSLRFTPEPWGPDCRAWELPRMPLRELDHFLEVPAWKQAESVLGSDIMVREPAGGLCLGMSCPTTCWPNHLRRGICPHYASVSSSIKWGFRALPHSALGSPTSLTTRVITGMGIVRGCRRGQPARDTLAKSCQFPPPVQPQIQDWACAGGSGSNGL